MNIKLTVLVIMLFLFIAGCSSANSLSADDLKDYEVIKTTDETVQDDFIFRLISEKEQYKEGEEVKLYGEIEYTGNSEEVIINHSSSAIIFPMREEAREYEIGYGVNEIGLSTILKNRVPYREEYQKSAGYIPDEDSKDYVKFIENFLNRDDFPPGYYVVEGSTDFSVESGNASENQKRYNIEATIDFKVID